MVKSAYLFLLFSILVFSCNQQSDASIGQYTTIEYNELIDAGTVAKGEVIKKEIEVKNTGTYPLIIAEVKASCSCTVSEFTQEPVQPGDVTIIKAEVDTDQTGKGVIEKPITIVANTRPSTSKVIIKARVID